MEQLFTEDVFSGVSLVTAKKQTLMALEKTRGIVSTAADMVKINRRTHYRWYKDDENYREAVDEINELAIDFAESKLHGLNGKGDPAAIIFFLKCRAKRRGYMEKQEVDLRGRAAISWHEEKKYETRQETDFFAQIIFNPSPNCEAIIDAFREEKPKEETKNPPLLDTEEISAV